MNHRYIDEASVPERYLEHKLAPDEKAEFEAHLLGPDGLGRKGSGCDECADRLLLAQIFLDKRSAQAQPVAEPAGYRTAWGDLWESPSDGKHGKNGSERGEGRGGPRNSVVDAKYSATYPIFSGPIIPIPTEQTSDNLAGEGAFLSVQPDTVPWTARFVAQFTPWQLTLILTVAAALLLLAPTAYYLWVLTQLRGHH